MVNSDQSEQFQAPVMVSIPAGEFIMGTTDRQIERLVQVDELARRWLVRGSFTREQPQHQVHLSNYAIGKYPVTVGEYRLFIHTGGYVHADHWSDSGWAWRVSQGRNHPQLWGSSQWTGEDRLPVVGVSWYEAMAYCRWLSECTGLLYRLPTEAEWEKAARGTDERLFPWGNRFDPKFSNTNLSGLGHTVAVDHFSPGGDSPYGCADMGGNASEWTLSQFRPYPFKTNGGRNTEAGEEERVIRGGSWYKPSLRARASARGMNIPSFTDHDVGFRLVQV